MKRRVKTNAWGNTSGYEGSKKVIDFNLGTTDKELEEWINGMTPDDLTIGRTEGMLSSAFQEGRKAERERMLEFAEWWGEEYDDSYEVVCPVFNDIKEGFEYWQKNVEGKK